MRRITEREWLAGDLLPNETELAAQFGCARATVNRAMRDIANSGFIIRRRKGGSHVAMTPVRRAVLSIPVIRIEVESSGKVWRHVLHHRDLEEVPPQICKELALPGGTKMLHTKSVHFADDRPFVYEDRWINLAVLPEAAMADFAAESANEWLVRNAPYTTGSFTLCAQLPDAQDALHLDVSMSQAILVAIRTTWLEAHPITRVRLAYTPSQVLQMQL